MTKGLNIVSRLTFENIPDGTLPASIPDENQYSNYSYTKGGMITIETIDGIKFIKLNSPTAKISSPLIITDQSKKNFQAEFDVIFDSLKADTHLVSIGVTTFVNALRVVASNNPAQGLRLINGNNQISSYYRFENNKKYTICVGFKDNVISMYIDGTIIGYSYSEEFINALNVTTPSTIILGAPLNNTNDANTALYGKLGNINISIGTTFKHEESYTKYGTNLVSFLNFENLLTTGTYKTGVEAVYEGIEWRGVESATYSNGYGNIKNISTDITGEFTVNFSLKKFKVANANILKYGNYSVDYVAGFIPGPEPDVEVNEYTTAALNFEYGLFDQIGTTVWTKEGTSDITSVNKIFGTNSFETKALGDNLSTTSKLITGGTTPFTIEFYASVNASVSASNNFFGAGYALLSQNRGGGDSDQQILVDANLIAYLYRGAYGGASPFQLTRGSYKNLRNELNKYTFTYDGSALRLFINDQLDIIVGTNNGWDVTNPYPFTFFDNHVSGSSQYRVGTKGLIDNINIHDGIATKVRDHDPYEEFLVVDLAFDGENNSTKIVDNAVKKHTDNFTLVYIPASIDTENYVINNMTSTHGIISSNFSMYPNSLDATSSTFKLSFNNNDNYISSIADFTFELWLNLNILTGYKCLYRNGASIGIYIYMNKCVIYNNGATTYLSDAFTVNTWHHLAIVRKNGTIKVYVDGINNGSSFVLIHDLFGTGSTILSDNYTQPIYALCNEIIISARAKYTSNFIPSTQPLSTNKNINWTVNGNAKISTDQKFDGFSSLYLNGSNSWLEHPISTTFDFSGYNDFTISFEFMCTEDKRSYFFRQNDNGSFIDGIGIYWYSRQIHVYGYANNGGSYITCLDIKSQTNLNLNQKYRFTIVRSNMLCKLYVDDISVNSVLMSQPMTYIPSTVRIGADKLSDTDPYGNTWRFKGYIKNFKIYKGVAVIPESPVGKIQLDFDNNLVDKYGNSTWTNNGVTFDQVNSVKGHAAKFNGSNSILSISNNQNLNFENKNFVLSYDFKNAIFDSVNNRYLFGNGMAIAHGAFWRLFGTSSSKSGSFNLNYNSANYGLTNTVEVENNYYNEKILRNSDTLVGFKNDVAISALNVINTFNVDFKNMSIGTASSLTSGVSYFNGYLDNFKSYKEDLLSDVDIYKTNESSTITISGDMLRLYSTASNGVWFKNKDCPNVKDFIFKTTIIKTLGEQSIILRTSNWRNVNDTFAYLVVINGATIGLAKGSNSLTTTSFSWLKQSTSLDSTLTKYNIEVIANDNNIKIYCNDVLYIDYSGSDYLNSGLVGFRSYGVADYKIDYYSIEDLNNNILYYKDWKSKIDNVIDKPAVHLPLETNATNIGFTPLTINSVGNPTYTTIDGKKCIKFESGNYLSINSNNIFNLGTSSDFYIEMRIYVNNYTLPNRIFASALNSENSRIGLGSNTSNYYKKLYINAKDLSDYPSINECLIDQWNDIKIYRKNQKLTILLNGVISEYNVNQKEFDFSSTFIGGTPTTYFNGYMSNFKMFVGTSEIPETYNDKKVLELDFKPTGKSYLFKDNNNKCVIHPVNITQRDYQDSQYCCTFNGVDQHLQLGKNDLFNFGRDDFIINIKYKINNATSFFLLQSDGSNITALYIRDNRKVTFSNNGSYYIYDLDLPGDHNELTLQRDGINVNLYVNGIIHHTVTINVPLNFNDNNNTFIGKVANNSGTIYSIKVLRNTTDLSLLEDENTDVIIGDTTLTLSNGTDSQEVIFDNKDQNDFRFVHSNDSTKLIVNEQILEVPNVENELNELSLFTDFNAEAKDIKTYNIAFEDEDTFSGNVPIHTQFGEIEDIDTVTDIFHVVDQGDFIVNGFFEGRPEDSRYQIRNRFDYIVMHSDSGPFNYNGINERYIDDYEIYLPDTSETMPIPTEPMIRGYITISITPTECEGINFGVKVFRRSDNKLIGIYDFNNYICTIDNLDCNKRYDCIIFDQDVNLESRCLSNRTPIPY